MFSFALCPAANMALALQNQLDQKYVSSYGQFLNTKERKQKYSWKEAVQKLRRNHSCLISLHYQPELNKTSFFFLKFFV